MRPWVVALLLMPLAGCTTAPADVDDSVPDGGDGLVRSVWYAETEARPGENHAWRFATHHPVAGDCRITTLVSGHAPQEAGFHVLTAMTTPVGPDLYFQRMGEGGDYARVWAQGNRVAAGDAVRTAIQPLDLDKSAYLQAWDNETRVLEGNVTTWLAVHSPGAASHSEPGQSWSDHTMHFGLWCDEPFALISAEAGTFFSWVPAQSEEGFGASVLADSVGFGSGLRIERSQATEVLLAQQGQAEGVVRLRGPGVDATHDLSLGAAFRSWQGTSGDYVVEADHPQWQRQAVAVLFSTYDLVLSPATSP